MHIAKTGGRLTEQHGIVGYDVHPSESREVFQYRVSTKSSVGVISLWVEIFLPSTPLIRPYLLGVGHAAHSSGPAMSLVS